MPAIEVRVPDLELGDISVSLSAWLVKAGAEVMPGERIVELTAGEAVVQLVAPAAGLMAKRCIAENQVVRPGDLLALISAGDG